MRLGVVGSGAPDSLESNIVAAARRLGHDAMIVGDLGAPQNSLWRARATRVANRVPTVDRRRQEALARHVPAGLDLLLVCTASAAQMLPSTVEQLRRQATRVACWFVDPVTRLDQARFIVSPYDAVFLTDATLVEHLRYRTPMPLHLLPEGCDSLLHKMPAEFDVGEHVAVVGNYRAERVALLRRLDRDGIPLRLYGSALPSWCDTGRLARLHTGTWVTGAEKAHAFATSAAVLNDLSPAELDKVNCRVFEATASGAVVVAESRPLLSKLFDIEAEMLTFQTYEELLLQLAYALDSPEELRVMRHAASRRSHSTHTLEQRVQTIIDRVCVGNER